MFSVDEQYHNLELWSRFEVTVLADDCPNSDAYLKISLSNIYTYDDLFFSFFTLVSSNAKPADVIVSIREFINHFFLCKECATHFVNMTYNAENEINTYNQSILYLWRSKSIHPSLCFFTINIRFILGHNTVNKRLRYENYTNDPYWPKVPFPTKQQCHQCVQKTDDNGDAMEYNESATYVFFKEFYHLNHSTTIPSCDQVLFILIVMINIFISNKYTWC